MFKKVSSSSVCDWTGALPESCIVVLNGWGFTADVWQAFSGYIGREVFVASVPDNQVFSDVWLTQLGESIPKSAHLIAWSIGVKFASALWMQGVRWQTTSLVSGTTKFIREDGLGLRAFDFKKFARRVDRGGESARQYFAALVAHGCERKVQPVEYLQSDLEHYSKALEVLAANEEPARFSNPVVEVVGDRDVMVACESSGVSTALRVIRGAAHQLPLAFARELSDIIKAQISQEDYRQRIAESFGRAAARYDQVAELQQRVAKKLITSHAFSGGELVLDVGCGTGYLSQLILEKSGVKPVGVDISAQMIDRYSQRGFTGYVADAESLPFADGSVDVIVSSLAIQWCAFPERVFKEFRRVLKPSGRVVLATLADGTLCELQRAADQSQLGRRINRFPPIEDWCRFAESAEFAVEMASYNEGVSAKTFTQLLRHLRDIGANCVIGGDRAALNRGEIDRWGQALATLCNGGFNTTYHVVEIELT